MDSERVKTVHCGCKSVPGCGREGSCHEALRKSHWPWCYSSFMDVDVWTFWSLGRACIGKKKRRKWVSVFITDWCEFLDTVEETERIFMVSNWDRGRTDHTRGWGGSFAVGCRGLRRRLLVFRRRSAGSGPGPGSGFVVHCVPRGHIAGLLSNPLQK